MYSIAIDGPAAAGKSTVAKQVAKRLGILHLNTGSLYRALGLFAYQQGIENKMDENGMPALSKKDINIITSKAKVEVDFIDGQQHTILNGDDVTDILKTPIVSEYSSLVSAVQEIRDHVLELQRDVARNHSVVMEGRDIASNVLPNADYKFFITASPEVRAERCYNELLEKGLMSTYEEVLQSIKERDTRDTTRECCPLVIVPDALIVDTTNMTIDQVVDFVAGVVKE